MKKLLLFSLLCCSACLSFAQLTKPIFSSEFKASLKDKKPRKPIEPKGYLDLSSIFPVTKLTEPTNFMWETKYWINKKPSLVTAFGFGWQFGKRLYGKGDNIVVENTDIIGHELGHDYSYLSGRFKLQAKGKFRPYIEVGSGWLLVTDKITSRHDNPDYNPNHTCPEGSAETISVQNTLRNQHRFGMDAEGGMAISLNEKLSLQIGVGYLRTKNLYVLEESNSVVFSEAPTNHKTYQWQNKALSNSVRLKIGISILIYNDPNIIYAPSTNTGNSRDDRDDSGGGGGGGCND